MGECTRGKIKVGETTRTWEKVECESKDEEEFKTR